ncbi:hypothetical protein L5515_014576 [Caenorhabditis briggsae]|uniref:ETS domain-containing protein n=1 Tax=Caenorhabditis briggsae TaxID=6238 RepID=A0AAE9J733_CAEBR|nr:hypothetical protein L5515_014576 [Caenorhabditis briggsae]
MPAFKSKDLNRNRTFLLEFLWNLLNNPTHHDIIVWENKKELVFRIMNKDAVAVLWGQKKCGKAMNYEKLSRALRHFYGTHVKKISGKYFHYQFINMEAILPSTVVLHTEDKQNIKLSKESQDSLPTASSSGTSSARSTPPQPIDMDTASISIQELVQFNAFLLKFQYLRILPFENQAQIFFNSKKAFPQLF